MTSEVNEIRDIIFKRFYDVYETTNLYFFGNQSIMGIAI